MSKPLISVIMPAYNAELFIGEAIESILSQTFSDFEFLIYNDGSKDKTHEIISSFKDERILYKKVEDNAGYLKLLNCGLLSARGRYIARMDADDISFPNRLEQQYKYLEKNPQVGICGSSIEFIGQQSGVERRPNTFDEIQFQLFFGCPITHPTVMMRTDLIRKNKLFYKQEYYYAEDHYFFVEAARYFKIVNLPEILLKYRIHKTQVGSAKWKEQFIAKSKIQATIFNDAIIQKNQSSLIWLSNFFKETSIPDNSWMQNVDYYKNEIIRGNKEVKIYPQPLLEKAVDLLFESKKKNNIYNYFFQKYYNRKSYNPLLIFQFFKEKFKPYSQLGIKLTMYFIVKCLIGYRKKTTIQI